MGWIWRVTRFADVHWVFAQERRISCGVACVIMAAYKINKYAPGVKSEFSEDDILARATELFGPDPLGANGLNNGQMLQLLNDPMFKMDGWREDRMPATDVPAKIITKVGETSGFGPKLEVKPIIAHIKWNGEDGGHWVLVDTIRRYRGATYATVCDPWDGNVHVTPATPGATFDYSGESVWGFSTAKRHKYEAPSPGQDFWGLVISR
jgi:hypothetical protein